MRRSRIFVAGLCMLAIAQSQAATRCTVDRRWIASWEAAPTRSYPMPSQAPQILKDQTIRIVARLSASGSRLRVRLTNEFGSKPLKISAASIETVNADNPSKPQLLTFGGAHSTIVAPGAPLLSDPINFTATASSRVAINLYFAEATEIESHHLSESQDATIFAVGDYTVAHATQSGTPSLISFVSEIDVEAQSAAAIVVLGESRTEGNGRWLETLAERLAQRRNAATRSVVNASVQASELARAYPVTSATPFGGQGALAAFDRDVLSVAGGRYLMLVDAINDIGHPGWGAEGHINVPVELAPSVEQVIATYQQLIARAKARNLKIIGATLMPFKDTTYPGFYTAEKEAKRQAINRWIRQSAAFDAVADFDAVVRDSSDPARFKAGLSAVDGYDLSAMGEHTVADSIDLGLFKDASEDACVTSRGANRH